MLYKTKLNGHMRKTAKIFTLFLVGFFLILVFYPESLEAKEADLTINGEYLSADLKGTSLNAIFEALEREKGIWFKGDLSLLDEKVTVQFTDHSLEDGIKRILASMNYCLVFESDGVLLGAILIGKEKGGPASVQYTADVTKKTIPLRVKKKNVNPGRNNEADIVMDGPPISKSTESSNQNFKILTNTKSQDAPAKMTPEQQLETLKVLRAQPSQGAPDEMTAEQIKNMKAIRDQQPQGVPNK